MPQSWDMGHIILLPLRRKAYWGFSGRPKNSAGFEPANSGSTRPPKPSCNRKVFSKSYMQWGIKKIEGVIFTILAFSIFTTSWLAWNHLRWLYIVAPFTSYILLLMKRSHVISTVLIYTLEYCLFTWRSFTIYILCSILFLGILHCVLMQGKLFC